MSFPVAVALVLAIAVLTALVTGPSRWRRSAAVLVGLAAVPVPFFNDSAIPFARCITALMVVALTLRSIDLYRGAHRLPLRRRIFHLVAVFDTRLAQQRQPGLDVPPLLRGLAWLALAGAAMALVVWTAGAAPRALRWAAAFVFMIAAMETCNALIPVAWGLAGVRPPLLHDAPYLSRSVTELWGARWNRVVGGWLRINALKPLVRRGRPLTGQAAAFAVSGLIHAYIVLSELPWIWAALMGCFFLAQLPLILLERSVQLSRFGPTIGRVWTVGALALVSPLFTESLLRILDRALGAC